MSFKTKFILISLLFAVLAFLLGKQIWPPDPMGPSPTAAQLPFFIFMSILESVTFGVGVAFICLGWPLVQKVTGKAKTLTILVFLSIAWQLVSWWPHDNLHISIGMDMQKLLYLEYGFHLTLIVSSAILAYAFFQNFFRK
jgi:hypothetical protein